MKITLALILIAGVAGCAHHPDVPDPTCNAQCQDEQAESNIRRTLAVEGYRGVPAEQLARDREALEREWCITKAQRLDHDRMVPAMKECRDLWPDRPDATIKVQ